MNDVVGSLKVMLSLQKNLATIKLLLTNDTNETKDDSYYSTS